MTAQPVGPILDGLGCRTGMADTDLVVAAVVLMAVVDVDGNTTLRLCDSENVSWIVRRGMLETALDTERGIHNSRPTVT